MSDIHLPGPAETKEQLITPSHVCVSLFLKLSDIEALMKKENQKILTPLVSLDTPGKATVQVVILADPVSRSRCSKKSPGRAQ